ncbi:FAD-dependent oxidoreductase [Microbulbifer sp. 2205BS26-8]|uniref:FAD-dependent oxidoreductase n=1 Tax=Microbulbifer sp. 2205BS26-8 TaxID=3064386 RepID=UPI00273EA664|nr:FAD-dependent oxidoreductase [Microbulbifer sp. 2205BS26-8]MDP5209550.1 FAD-dependent oxidoreductase [Microbulbifer sp. 2205BS26-8]
MNECKTTPTKSIRFSETKKWHYKTDVSVIGYGGAGACAAIEAADAGALVTIFELSSGAGGSTALSSAEIYMGGDGGTRVQAATGHNDTNQAMIDYLSACAGPQADADKIKAYVEGSRDHFNWLVEQGVPFKDSEYKERAIMALTDDCLLYTGSEKAWPFKEIATPCPRGHNLEVEGDNGGPLFMKILGAAVERREIQVHFNCRALALIQDDTGVIRGIRIREDMQEKNVLVDRGVILCTGGFAMNRAMLKKYAPNLLRCSEPIGNPGDMGTGILMGMGVGGAAINMHEGFVSVPYYPPASFTYGLFINAQGQRFINEDCYHGRVGAYILQQTGNRVYLVLSAEDYGDYEQVSYLGASVAGTGETIAELEQELDLPKDQLVQTLQTYNNHAKNGEDPVFHKCSEWLKPLNAPYVALDVTPGRGAFYPYFTLGGLDTRPSGEVLNPEGSIITGLYAAGRTACGVPRRGAGYNSGISVGDATFSGRMAGKAAAARVK